MQGFDLADTLVHINYRSGNIPQAIRNAEVLYRPKGNFIIITAQRDDAAIHNAVSEMVSTNFPNCQRVHFVSGGESDIIAKKAALIKEHNLTDFTDNNRAILAGIKELNTGAKLWVMTSDGRKPY